MPRTQSTVILESCKRTTKLSEPFDRWALFGRESTLDPFHPGRYNSISDEEWDKTFSVYNDADTAIKFFGSSLYFCLPARRWYQQVLTTQSHDIFVTVRDLPSQMMSLLISYHFGFSTAQEKPHELKPIEVQNFYFSWLTSSIDHFIRFFPSYGTLVNYDNMPSSHFDSSLSISKIQHTLDKSKYITNLDFCQEKINDIIQYYQKEYDEKIASLKTRELPF